MDLARLKALTCGLHLELEQLVLGADHQLRGDLGAIRAGHQVVYPEEPDVGQPEAGDLEIRFRPKGPHDVSGLNCAMEVRTKLYASRHETRQARAELIEDGLSTAPRIGHLGLWLVLADGWWTQTLRHPSSRRIAQKCSARTAITAEHARARAAELMPVSAHFSCLTR